MRKATILLFLSTFALVALCGCTTGTTQQESGAESSAAVEEELERLNESVTYLDTLSPDDMQYDEGMEAYCLNDTTVYYDFDQDGKCVGAFAFGTLYDTPLSEEEITEKLEAYLEPLLAEGDYEMDPVEYSSDFEEYTLCGYHKVNGIETQDFVSCTMDACGNVMNVQFPHQGEFADVDLGEIDADNVDASYESRIADEIGQTDFTIHDVILCKGEDGSLYLRFTAEYEEEDGSTMQEPVDIYLTGPSMAGDDADAQKVVSKGLGIRVPGGEAIAYTDDHGGFHGDGTMFIALRFSDDEVLDEIRESGEWNAFPLDETVETLIYGTEYMSEDGEEWFQYGPYVTDDDFNPLFPKVENGYYRLIDRYEPLPDEEDTDILDRYSFNFTLGVYDTDTDILYYCEFDT